MILATELQAIIAGAKKPGRASGPTLRVTVYKTWNDKGATLGVIWEAMREGATVSVADIMRKNPQLKRRTVEKTLQRLAREGRVQRFRAFGLIYWRAAA